MSPYPCGLERGGGGSMPPRKTISHGGGRHVEKWLAGVAIGRGRLGSFSYWAGLRPRHSRINAMLSPKRLVPVALLASVFAVAVLQANTPEDEARLKETGSCPSCNLADANLSGLVAERGDLSNANFSGANLYRAILRGADLTGASFNGADLTGAQLELTRGADLAGAITDSRTRCPNGQPGPCS